MAVLKWPEDFSWPYAGQPTEVPPQFARNMVTIQDQVYWLLNAVHLLNEAYPTVDELLKAVDEEGAKVLSEATARINQLAQQVLDNLGSFEQKLDALNQNIAITRNPVTGMNDYVYTAIKQVYDACRPHSATYAELDEAEGLTWSTLDGLGTSWYELDVMGRYYIFGNEEERVNVTPASHIGQATPGYLPNVFAQGSTYGEFDQHGFVYLV